MLTTAPRLRYTQPQTAACHHDAIGAATAAETSKHGATTPGRSGAATGAALELQACLSRPRHENTQQPGVSQLFSAVMHDVQHRQQQSGLGVLPMLQAASGPQLTCGVGTRGKARCTCACMRAHRGGSRRVPAAHTTVAWEDRDRVVYRPCVGRPCNACCRDAREAGRRHRQPCGAPQQRGRPKRPPPVNARIAKPGGRRGHPHRRRRAATCS